MLRSASSFANSRLHAVKAEVLVLASGKDQLIPSQEEAERLFHMLPACQIRNFAESGHTLFMSLRVLVSIAVRRSLIMSQILCIQTSLRSQKCMIHTDGLMWPLIL